MPLTPKQITDVCKQYMADKISLKLLTEKIGKSTATAHRYVKIVASGQEVTDLRAKGNNRRYKATTSKSEEKRKAIQKAPEPVMTKLGSGKMVNASGKEIKVTIVKAKK